MITVWVKVFNTKDDSLIASVIAPLDCAIMIHQLASVNSMQLEEYRIEIREYQPINGIGIQIPHEYKNKA